MRRAWLLLIPLQSACSPLVDDRDTSPAMPTFLEGELEIDALEGASRFELGRHRYAWLIAPGDVNGDGFDDLVVLERQSEEPRRGFVHVFLGSPTALARDLRASDSSVSFELGEGFGGFDRPRVIGDLDGDGRAEFAFEHDPYAAEQDLVVFRWEDVREGVVDANEAGARIRTTELGGHVRVWSAGDLDGDGADDLWLDLEENSGSLVLPGGPGFFDGDRSLLDLPHLPRPELGEDEWLSARDFSDLDGDGRPEAVVEIQHLDGSDRIEVRPVDLTLGDTAPTTFTMPVRSLWAALQLYEWDYRTHALDFDGDGRQDLPFAQAELGVSVLFGGDPLTAAAISSFDSTAYEMDAAGDVNGDGFDDFLVLPYNVAGEGWVQLFYGNAEGTVFPGATIHTRTELGLALDAIPAGDLNGDGFDEFVLSQGTCMPNPYLHIIYGAGR